MGRDLVRSNPAVSPEASSVESPDRAPAGRGSPWKLVLRIALTAALLLLLFWQVRWEDVWTAVRALDSGLLLVVCALWPVTQLLQFVKWDMLARQAGEGVSRADIHRGFWVGYTLGLITPGRIGQLARGLALHNCSLSRATGLTVVERGYTGLVMNAVGMLALVALPFLGWKAPGDLLNPLVAGACLAVGLLLLLVGVFVRGLMRPLRWIADKLPLRDKLHKAVDVLTFMAPGRAILILLLSVASLASSVLQFALLVQAGGGVVSVPAGMLAATVTFFVKGALPISIGSLGVGEWSAMLAFSGLGVEPAVAVAASLLLFAINVFVPSLIGIPFLSTLRVPEWPKRGDARS